MKATATHEYRHRASVIRLRPEYEERYIILHKHVFPGVLKRIRKSNVRNYSIFLLDGVLFSHLEYIGRAYEADMKAMAGDETTREWWKLTDPMQEPFSSHRAGEWWARLDLISCFGKTITPSSKSKRIYYTAEINPGVEDVIRSVFADFEELLGTYFRKAHIQHQSVYLGLGKICVYLEYSGKNFARDDKALNSRTDVVRWDEEVGRYLKAPWKEAREVFYTS
jgi:L-rhamnose mutarotase